MASPQDIPLSNPPGVDPSETRAPELLGWSIAMLLLSALAVALRFLSRWLIRKRNSTILHLEDWLALVSLLFSWMLNLITIYSVDNLGYGRHLGSFTLRTFQQNLLALWVFQLAYNLAVGLTKLSLIALLWRVFSTRVCHIVLATLAGFTIIWMTAACLADIFTCFPVESLWNFSVKAQRCIDPSKFWFASAVPNMFIDLVLLILPNLWIVKLKVNKHQKLGLVIVFTLGVFVTVCSVLRLWQLVIYFRKGLNDQPWDTVPIGIWSVIEGNASIVCCCLPSMRPLVRLVVSGRATSHDDRGTMSTFSCCGPLLPVFKVKPDQLVPNEQGKRGQVIRPVPPARIFDKPMPPIPSQSSSPRESWSRSVPAITTITDDGPSPLASVRQSSLVRGCPSRRQSDGSERLMPTAAQNKGGASAQSWLRLEESRATSKSLDDHGLRRADQSQEGLASPLSHCSSDRSI